jgi:hypothetical protein
MSQDPRDIFRKLQQGLNNAQQKGSGGLPGGPRNFIGGAAGLILLGTGVVVVNNALFNGKLVLPMVTPTSGLTRSSGWWSPSYQVYEDRRRTNRDIQ